MRPVTTKLWFVEANVTLGEGPDDRTMGREFWLAQPAFPNENDVLQAAQERFPAAKRVEVTSATCNSVPVTLWRC